MLVNLILRLFSVSCDEAREGNEAKDTCGAATVDPEPAKGFRDAVGSALGSGLPFTRVGL